VRAFSYIDDVAPIIARGPLNLRARNEIFNVGADVPYSATWWFGLFGLLGLFENVLKKLFVIIFP
jgi:hypothetical protein